MAQIGLEVGLFMNLLVSRKKLLGNTGDFLWSYGGYLIVSALCDLCGVVLNVKNARCFVSECIENLHDTLKANLNVNGTNYSLSLNDELVSEFIEFYIAHNSYEYYFLKTPPLKNRTLLYTFNLLERAYFNSVKDSVIGGQIGYFEPGKVTVEVTSNLDGGGYGWYNYIITGTNFTADGNLTHSSYSDLDSDFELRVPYNSVSDMVVNDNVNGKVTLYPEAQGCKTLEEYKAKYKNEPSKITLDSSIVGIKTKWKKEETEIYISDGNVESLPSGVSINYKIITEYDKKYTILKEHASNGCCGADTFLNNYNSNTKSYKAIFYTTNLKKYSSMTYENGFIVISSDSAIELKSDTTIYSESDLYLNAIIGNSGENEHFSSQTSMWVSYGNEITDDLHLVDCNFE